MSHRSILLKWPIQQTSDEVEIIYREIQEGETEETILEIDDNVCARIKWQRIIVFPEKLIKINDRYYRYTMLNLEPNTTYGVIVKTFGSNEQFDSRSDFLKITTFLDVPKPPKIVIFKKTDSMLGVRIIPHKPEKEKMKKFFLDVYEFSQEIKTLDERDYCKQPVRLNQLEFDSDFSQHDDYDDCCDYMETLREDEEFRAQMMQQFSCSIDKKNNCLKESDKYYPTEKPFRKYESNDSYIFEKIISKLKRYHLYTLQARVCNSFGCSSQSWLTERTNSSIYADKLLDLKACRVGKTSEYHVYFSEPTNPNGAILSYIIHYNSFKGAKYVNCVSRMQHAESKYRYTQYLNESYDQVAVRVNSLSGREISDFVPIVDCSKELIRIAGFDAPPSHGINIFLLFFLIGAGGTVLWICYKRRLWRKIPKLKKFLPLNWRNLLMPSGGVTADDRQILVNGFESVRFHNNSDDEHKYLE